MATKLKMMLYYGVGLAITAVFVLPLYWSFIASLRQPGLPPPTSIEWWPVNAHWENYLAIFEILPLTTYIVNSFKVVVTAVPLTLLVASLAGFAMTQLPNERRKQLFVFNVLALMVPGVALWLFRAQILRWLGLIDTFWALILPAFAASNPLFVLLFYWGYRRIPPDVFESARLDGAGAWTVWWQIAQPLARPTTVGVIVLTFVMYWSDFISPVLYIYDTSQYTLPVGIQILNQMDATNWPLLMAAAVIMTIPILVLFIALQRFFLSEISLSNLFDKS